MSIISKFLSKFEAIDLSKRHAGRMTNYFDALAARGEWGNLVGYVKLSDAPKRIQIAVYQKIMLFTKFESDDVTGQVLSFLAVKTLKKPTKNHFKLSADGNNVSYMNTQFTVLDDSSTTGKDLLAVWNQAVTNKSSGSTDPVKPAGKDPKQLVNIANVVLALLKSSSSNSRNTTPSDWQAAELDGKYADASVRHWGRWQLPEDVDPHSEDAQDYDWEVLSDDSWSVLNTIVKGVRAKYPEVNINATQEEKNWIHINVSYK